MSKKKMAVANFNIVFLKETEERPLLEYFDSIVMPALSSGIVKKSGDSTFLLMNLEIIEDEDGEYVLVGNIVKKTTLEVLSDLDTDGNLIQLDNKYPSAPFSIFMIYLRNHRMLLIENQKGSPNLKSFASTIKYIMNRYTRYQNQELKKAGKETLPIPFVNIIGIPMRENIKNILAKVEKINKLTLRFYPLNGDIDYSEMFTGLTTNLRQKVGSKNGEIVLKSPSSIEGVIDVLTDAGGTVEPIFKVTYPNKSKVTISNDTISENMNIDISGNTNEEGLVSIANQGKEMESIKYTSSSNVEIYDKNKGKIIPFIKKKE